MNSIQMSQAEVERATSMRVHAGFGISDSATRDTLDGDEPSVRIRIPTGPVTPSAEEKKLHKASGHALSRRWCRWCAVARTADEPHLRKQQPETDEAVSRIEFDPAELEREEDQTSSTPSLNAFDDGSESSTATLCSTKAFSEYLTETTVALRPKTCVGAVAENCAGQTSDRNVGETWSKNQSSEPDQD